MMSLKRLGHLLALADEMHFARAAERVHLSQPAFSRSIQALEQEVGQTLFDRDNGPVQPTPAGLFLIGRARKLLLDARSLSRDIQLYGDSQLGDTALGLGPFPAATLMPRAAPLLRQRHPNVCLRVEVNNWALLLERLHSEDIEFFVADARDVPLDASLRIEPLVKMRGDLYVRAGHPLLGRRIKLADAWPYGVAATKLPQRVTDALASILGLAPDAPLPLAFECDAVTLLHEVALSSDTIVATLDAAVQAEVKAGKLAALNITDLPTLHSEMSIVQLGGRTRSPMASKVIEVLREVAGV